MGDERVKDGGVKIKPGPGAFEGSVMASTTPSQNSGMTNASRVEDGHKQVASGNDCLDQVMSKTSAEELEAGVRLGMQLLDNLRAPLNAALAVSTTTTASDWVKAIQQLQDSAKPARTVVGVVYVPSYLKHP